MIPFLRPPFRPASSRRTPRLAWRGLLAWLPVLVAGMPGPASAQPAAASGAVASESGSTDRKDFSEAEKLLFMGNAIRGLKPPLTLAYAFRKSGSLEPAFDDRVSLKLAAAPGGACCRVEGEFLSGSRRLDLPAVDDAEANPVLLFFLERDVREMQRITKGSPTYYRKRIRMAAYQAAKVSAAQLSWRGRPVQARQVELAPYDDDPARSRYERYARKTYRVLLSDAVPGGIAAIRTEMRSATAGEPPLVVEELLLDGVEPPEAFRRTL